MSDVQSGSEKAGCLFNEGYNCAQSVFAAFADEMGMDFEQALKLSAPFGGGLGRLREVCGAVSGMCMVAGAKYGCTVPGDEAAKLEHYALIQRMVGEFKDKHGSIICRELLEQAKGEDGAPAPSHAQTCGKFVCGAAEIMQSIAAKNE